MTPTSAHTSLGSGTSDPAVAGGRKPRLLDLFCGAGGAAKGYHDAGFDVYGVDIDAKLSDRYPFTFRGRDALVVLTMLIAGEQVAFTRNDKTIESLRLSDFAAVHASPPCQDYSVTASLHDAVYPRLIEPIRDLLMMTSLPYVIENVQGAKSALRNPILLCGSSFGLGVRRHRLFELSFPVLFVPPCAHHLQPEPIDVTGTGGPAHREPGGNGGIHRKPRNLAHAREVMGIDWMTRPELSEAIPPAYTEWVGEQLLSAVAVAA